MNTQQKIIKNKLGLLNLAETLGSVSKACSVMCKSQDVFLQNKVSDTLSIKAVMKAN